MQLDFRLCRPAEQSWFFPTVRLQRVGLGPAMFTSLSVFMGSEFLATG